MFTWTIWLSRGLILAIYIFHSCFKKKNSQNMEVSWMSTDRRIVKEDVVHIHNGILPSHKQWNNATCSNINGPRDYHIKWSQRKTNTIGYHLYVESNTNVTKELIYKTEAHDFKIKFRVTKGQTVAGGGITWEDGINTYTLLYIR